MQWQNWPVPDPAPDEVRVRHTAIGVNFADTNHRGALDVLLEHINRSVSHCATQPGLAFARLATDGIVLTGLEVDNAIGKRTFESAAGPVK